MSFDHIVELMTAQPDDIQAAFEGAEALRVKANRNMGIYIFSMAQEAIVAFGGHVQLVKAMSMHTKDEMLCEKVCQVLTYLPRAALIAAGAAPVLAAVAQTHSGRAKDYAEKVLRRLGLKSEVFQKVQPCLLTTITRYLYSLNAISDHHV